MKKITIFVCIISLVVALSGCAQKTEKVRIGYLAISNSLPLYVAIEKGFFEENGIDFELVVFQTSNDLIEALIAGRIDAEISASTAVIYNAEAFHPGNIKTFSVNLQTKLRNPDSIIVRDDSGIYKIQDLAGKTIGVFPGSTFVIITKLIISDFVDPDQVIIEQIPPNAQIEALAAGRIDALYTLEPFSILALEKANGRILESGPAEKYVLDPLPGGINAFSSDFVNENPRIAKSIIAAYDKSIEFIRTNESEAREYIPKYTLTGVDLAKKVNIAEFWKYGEIQKEPIEKYADILFEEGGIEKRIEIENIIFESK